MTPAARALFAAAALLALFSPLSARASDCGSTDYRLSLDSTVPEENIIRSQSNAALAVIQRANQKQGDIVEGLTSVTYHSTYKVAYTADMLADGTVCTHVEDITVFFNIPQPPDVYLASEIANDACMSDVVLEHERKHLAIARATIEEGRDQLESRVGRELDGRNAERAMDMKDGMAAFDRRITGTVDTVTRALYTQAQARNDALDSQAEYERITNACPK